ncbi:hypothetical protein M8C21_024059, partial [Ambrosia artemisiifolia]
GFGITTLSLSFLTPPLILLTVTATLGPPPHRRPQPSSLLLGPQSLILYLPTDQPSPLPR